MENLSLWKLWLPFVVAIISWLWLLWARIKGWENGVREQEQLEPDPDNPDEGSPPTTLFSILWEQKWNLILLLLFIAVAAYMILFAPPRIGGEIPIRPNQPGRPFFNFHWQRDYIDKYDEQIGMVISLAGTSASMLALVWGQWQKKRFGGEVALLLAGLTLAGIGQWVLKFGTFVMSASLYGIAILCFVSWGWMARERLRDDLEARPQIPRQIEWLLVIAIFFIAAFSRLYALQSVPYGIEGDESKWIFEVVEIMIDGRYDSSAEYHRDALPGSFYMQAPLRQISPIPLAALGTFLLSISVMDISASRLANVESHVKLWPILALALLALSIHQRRWQIYGLSGWVLAIGLITYDTVLPVFLVMFILIIVELFVTRVDLKSAVKYVAAFLFPPLMTLPLLVPYFVGRLNYYRIGDKGWNENWWSTFTDGLSQVAKSWFVEARFDFIYNRQGPFINAILLPFLVFGIVLALMTIKRRVSRWAVLWALLVIIPVPVMTASPFGRVYYPGVAAVYALIAIGGYLLMREIARILGRTFVPLGWIVGITILAWLPLYNLYLYFNAVGEPGDRQVRREIGEFALSAAEEGAHLYLPYWPNADEPLFVEWQIAELYMRQLMSADQLLEAYHSIPLDNVLPHITANISSWNKIDVMLDREISSQKSQWESMREALFTCFPGGTLRQGEFFDRYRIDAAEYSEPNCVPVQFDLGYFGDDDNEQVLTWTLSNGHVSSINVVCEKENEAIRWIEAETFERGPGWEEDVAFVSGWQGNGYLVDNFGSQVAAQHTRFPMNGPAYAWIRYYKRLVDQSPAYLEMDNRKFQFADIDEDDTNEWIWERLGPFDISNDVQIWRITRPYFDVPEKFMALFIDSVVFTTDPDMSPFDDISYELVYDQTHHLTRPSQEGIIKVNLPTGRYFCHIGVESDQTLVNSYGQPDINSNVLEINVP
jgi:hypothetical protein